MNATTYKVFSEDHHALGIECPKCGRVLKFQKRELQPMGDEFKAASGILCPCGFTSERIERGRERSVTTPAKPNDASVPWPITLGIFALVGVVIFVWASQDPQASDAEIRAAHARAEQQSAIETAILSRRLLVGMTSDQVAKAWGEPRRKTRTTLAGHIDEFWHYDGDRLAHFDNGVLQSFEESSR